MRLFSLCTFVKFETIGSDRVSGLMCAYRTLKSLQTFSHRKQKERRSKEYFVIILAVKESFERFSCLKFIFGGTRKALDHSLTHSLTHSILINLFIKVKLNTLLLPPLLSITFVPGAFYAYVWHSLEGTSKAYIFSPHKRVASR